MTVFKSLPGFRDFYPSECSIREYIFQTWREVAGSCGFEQYDGPPLESLELFKKKSGEEILGQLYHFQDKGEREVAMRPEMTPTLARMAGARQREYKKPMKWFAIPQLFRYERAQRGRLREHFQWNADIMGEKGSGAEVELIALLIESFRRLGLTAEDVVVRVSDRQYWMDFMQNHAVSEDKQYEFLQVLDKIERTDEKVTQEKLGDLYPKVKQAFSKGASSERLSELMKLLQAMGYADWVSVDLTIVRGLAYYSGAVFEVHDRAGEFRAIAGGGRYDNLVKLITGQDLPAVGFGMGDVVLGEILKDKGLLPVGKSLIDAYVVIVDEALRSSALGFIRDLRDSGLKVDYSMSALKIGKQFQAAEDRGAKLAFVIDGQFPSGKCQVKILATREQSEISFTLENGKVAFKPSLEELLT
ncbi:MAG: histidine--tRNA ligase [Verrucomicrobiota bacterium]